jgi:protein involved in polysaccharide export with SLBB domain
MTCRALAWIVLVGLSARLSAQIRDQPLRDGDRILLKIWTDTIFGDTARVQQGSIVILPRLGAVSIASIPANRVADSLRSAYARLLRDAAIEVTPLRRVTVSGAVRNPGLYFLDTQSTVREAIAIAGGISDAGVTSHLTLLRDSSRIRMKDWQVATGETATVHSGDIVIVDRQSWLRQNAFTVVSGVSVLFSIILTLSKR